MTIYRENSFSEFVSIQTKGRHPGESRGPEHAEIPLWRYWIAALSFLMNNQPDEKISFNATHPAILSPLLAAISVDDGHRSAFGMLSRLQQG
jgi:hypothetical protein